jgi:alpha-galactosidase
VAIPTRKDTIVARRIDHSLSLDARNPAEAWQSTESVTFSTDWRGNNAEPALETKIQVLWFRPAEPRQKTMGSIQPGAEDRLAALYFRLECRYRELFVFEDSEPNGRRDHLWDRDVAEVFLQPRHLEPPVDPEQAATSYSEFEVAPNGMWIDLDIFPSGRRDLNSGLTCSVNVEAERKIWMAELGIPLRAVTANFDPNIAWRVNFYRIEGRCEPRSYLAWQPTGTEEPNFHVPRAFGFLRFEL